MIKNIIIDSRSIIAGLLLFIFGLYYANITLSYHCHIINGVSIVHSHFHGLDHAQNPDDAASHSESGLTLISAISNYISEVPIEIFNFIALYSDIYTIEFIYTTPIHSLGEINNKLLRGPPTQNFIG
ncbi:MAG: hypothetical protein R3Y50_00625 [Rikenellaceae bacterium]